MLVEGLVRNEWNDFVEAPSSLVTGWLQLSRGSLNPLPCSSDIEEI